MCLNCGCGMPNDDHGKPQMITEKKLQEAAEAAGQTMDETKENMKKSLAA